MAASHFKACPIACPRKMLCGILMIKAWPNIFGYFIIHYKFMPLYAILFAKTYHFSV